MSSYGYPGPEQGTPPSAYARDRFWSSPPTSGSSSDPWGPASNSYTPQLELSSFSNSNYLPYGQQQPNGIGPSVSSASSGPGQQSDLTFSGPSPPNPTQLQPISYPPPQSPCRGQGQGSGGGGGYTPSSTPTPLTPKQTNGLNGSSHNNHSSSSASNSPPNNGSNNNSRSFSYLEDGPQNPTSMQNGHPSNGPSSSSTTLLSLGGNGGGGPPGSNKNELINGHPNSDDNMYRSGNGPTSSSRYPGESPIKSEPNDSYHSSQYQQQHQSYYQNYTPGSSVGYQQHPHPYYQHHPGQDTPGSGGGPSYNKGPTGASLIPPPTYDPYHQHHQQQQMYQSSSYPQDHQHQDYNNYNSSPPERKHKVGGDSSPTKLDPSKMYDSSSGGLSTGSSYSDRAHYDPTSSSTTLTSSPPSSYRNNYNSNMGNSMSNSPPSTTIKIEDLPPPPLPPPILDKIRNSPPNSTTSPSDHPPPPAPHPPKPKGNGKGKKNANSASSALPLPLPPPEHKKDFGKGPAPKKKRKKRTKPEVSHQGQGQGQGAGQAHGNNGKDPKNKDSSNDFHRIKEEPHKEIKGKKGSKLQIQQDEADLLLELEESGGRDALGGDYDDDDNSSSKPRSDLNKDVPMVECGCFPADEVHAEPGPFYTHLGAAHDLVELRKLIETRTGFRGNQLRLEKVIYTGKEGKTSVGCPLAKWILRRGSCEEQLLFLVKHRKGHKCGTAWIVVCCVIWEGVPPHFSDNLYDTMVYKMNRFGIPTTRRSDTNEQRSCACQGVDPDTCGAAYSFGCAWSMFFNGCKYARSRNVRKFRLTEEHEESELEEKVQHLATHLAPLYERVAPDSYTNQIDHENEGLECRLGYRPGRPFSGVTACLDYCSHAHKDAHNMMNGCTVTVSLGRHRTLSKPDDEQFHVLPLYKLDDTDEHGSKEGQKAKIKKGQLEILKKFPCKVRIRKVPLLPSRRRAKAKSSSGAASSGANNGSKNEATNSSGGSTSTPAVAVTPSAVVPSSKQQNSDYSSEMPPAKREKLFDERLSNGGDAYGERFLNQYGQPSSSGLGHPFNDLGVPSSGGSLWNSHHFGPSSSPGGGGPSVLSNSTSQPLTRGGLPHPQPSSYFDHPSSTPGVGVLSGTSSSLSSLTELTNSTISRHGGGGSSCNTTTSGSGGLGASSSSTLLSSPGSSGGNPGSASSSGYSSMSPILPSFRNTFMTEAESLGLSSSSETPTSNSSPRSSAPNKHQQQLQQQHQSLLSSSSSTPAFQDHSSSSSSLPSSAYNSSASSSSYPSQHSHNPYASPPGGLYHPQPHNPCLPPSSPYHPHPHHHSHHHPHGGYHHHDTSSPYSSMASPTFPPSLTGWSSAAAAAAAYSSNYAAAAAYSSYQGLPTPSNFGMSSMNMNMNMSSMSSMNPMAPISHHHQYSPYHHPAMGPGGSNMNMNMGVSGPPRGNQGWGHGQPMVNQFNVNPFSSAVASPHTHPPPPAMNMNMNMNLAQGTPTGPPPPSCFVTPPKPKIIPEVNESSSDNEDCFKDPAMGGVAIALSHGSVILQCAKHEMHATTALKNPNRMYPSRICLIFYQHKSMNNRFHGWSEWEKKIEAKKLQEVKLINQGKMEASPRKMKQLIKEGYIQDSQ